MELEFNAPKLTPKGKYKAKPFESDSYDLYITKYGGTELIVVAVVHSNKYTPIHVYDLMSRLCMTRHTQFIR